MLAVVALGVGKAVPVVLVVSNGMDEEIDGLGAARVVVAGLTVAGADVVGAGYFGAEEAAEERTEGGGGLAGDEVHEDRWVAEVGGDVAWQQEFGRSASCNGDDKVGAGGRYLASLCWESETFPLRTKHCKREGEDDTRHVE